MPAPKYILVCLCLLAAACADNTTQREPATNTPASADPASASANSSTTCHDEDRFVEDGSIPVESSLDSGSLRLSEIRWSALDECERIVLRLSGDDDGSASFTGEVRAEFMRSHGIVRIEMPDVETVDTAATNAIFGGSLADRAYAVFSPEGRWIFVDVHLANAAEAFVSTSSDSAQIAIELRAGGESLPPAAVRTERVVVLRPRPGLVSYPLDIVGYARTFEANVVARLEKDGAAVADTFTTSTGWAEAWGYYAMSFQEGPTGALQLHVGEHSARDGAWQGAAVELEAR